MVNYTSIDSCELAIGYDMADAEGKLDLIQQHLDDLAADVKPVLEELGDMRDNVAVVKVDVEELKQIVDAIEGSVDTKINTLKDSVYTKIDEDIEQAKAVINATLRDDVHRGTCWNIR